MEELNLLGVPCPQNTARALIKLELLDIGEKMRILLDDGEPIDNFLQAIEIEPEYQVAEKNQNEDTSWKVVVQKIED